MEYKRYIEVFGGGGWVLFHKPPGRDFEVYNDFNGNLVNLYRCVREHPDELEKELTFMLNSRLDFEYMKYMLHSKAVLPDIRRAAYYFALIRYSYASSVDSFGSQPHSMWRNFPLIHAASKRLQNVVIENKMPMKTRWMRILSLCLVLVLLCGMFPQAMAAEVDTTPPDSENDATIATEQMISTEEAMTVDETQPAENTMPPIGNDGIMLLADDGNPEGYVYKNGLIWASDSSKEFDVVFDGVTQSIRVR